MAAAQFRF
jgi:hypothetical protein